MFIYVVPFRHKVTHSALQGLRNTVKETLKKNVYVMLKANITESKNKQMNGSRFFIKKYSSFCSPLAI